MRDDFTCQYCGRSAPEVELHVDHRTPVSRGGSDVVENLTTACVECNVGKSDRFVT
jgi:5-methylcytosine-specific restriction endonuclease McrA